MKLCFPVEKNLGHESAVYGHFGSAPVFLVVDAESRVVSEVINRDRHHAHGACSPLKALDGHPVDAVVVGGIGGGALAGLLRGGIRVYEAADGTVAANLDRWRQGELKPWLPGRTCGGHGHGNACSHGAH